jgi:hypothetical protein
MGRIIIKVAGFYSALLGAVFAAQLVVGLLRHGEFLLAARQAPEPVEWPVLAMVISWGVTSAIAGIAACRGADR